MTTKCKTTKSGCGCAAKPIGNFSGNNIRPHRNPELHNSNILSLKEKYTAWEKKDVLLLTNLNHLYSIFFNLRVQKIHPHSQEWKNLVTQSTKLKKEYLQHLKKIHDMQTKAGSLGVSLKLFAEDHSPGTIQNYWNNNLSTLNAMISKDKDWSVHEDYESLKYKRRYNRERR